MFSGELLNFKELCIARRRIERLILLDYTMLLGRINNFIYRYGLNWKIKILYVFTLSARECQQLRRYKDRDNFYLCTTVHQSNPW